MYFSNFNYDCEKQCDTDTENPSTKQMGEKTGLLLCLSGSDVFSPIETQECYMQMWI